MRTSREEWARRVRRWRQSGLSAREFADSIGVNRATLTYWAWRLGREQPSRPDARTRSGELLAARRAAFVEVVTGSVSDGRFELDLGNGRRLHIPASFESGALERLLAVLGPAR